MASVKVLLKTNKVDEKGECPVYIRITKNRKPKYIALPIKVHPNQWNSEKQRVKGSYPNSGRVNAFIATKVSEAERIMLEQETDAGYVTSQDIKEAIKGKKASSFFEYADQIIIDTKQKGKISTYTHLKAAVEKLKRFVGKKDLSFAELNLTLLKQYERHLRGNVGNSTNTIYSNMKLLKRLYGYAVREEIVEEELNPFRKYKVASEKTKRDYLTEEDLLKLEQLSISNAPVQKLHRDMYIFAAYAGGLRVSDVLQLRRENYDGTHIRVMTKKTGETIPIKLPQKAKIIVDAYLTKEEDSAPTDFIFPALKKNVDYSHPEVLFKAISSNTALINKNLKLLADKAGIEKAVSFHTSRHTWATRALRKGMRIEYVSKLMGHANIRTTQIYTKIVNEELDNAMSIFDE